MELSEPYPEEPFDFDALEIEMGTAGDYFESTDIYPPSTEHIEPLSPDTAPAHNALTGLFMVIESFNDAHDADNRLGHALVEGIIKKGQANDYVTEGMAPQDAQEIVALTGGAGTAAEESISLDHESIGLQTEAALQGFGLALNKDLLDAAHVTIFDSAQLAEGLSHIADELADHAGQIASPAIQQGLSSMLHHAVKGLHVTVMRNHADQVKSLGASPGLLADNAQPNPEEHFRMLEVFERGEEIANLCERLGSDPQKVNELRDVTRYYNEGMIVEWSIAASMNFYDDVNAPENGMPSPYNHRSHTANWDGFWNMVSQTQNTPNGTFLPELRSQALKHVNAHLRAALAQSNLPTISAKLTGSALTGGRALTATEDAARWPDPAQVEQTATMRAERNPRIAALLDRRARLESWTPDRPDTAQ